MYSQNNEEQHILDYFKGQTGVFLDVGSNDGKTFSNTRRLMELGWQGVCVEPSPEAFRRLKENTSQFAHIYCYPFALGTSNGMVKFHDTGSHIGNDHGLLSTLNASEKSRWPTQVYNEIEVQCFRWKTFLNRIKFRDFSFISIDAEGEDLNILKQIDLRATQMVCVEWNGKQDLKTEFDKLMDGFKIIYTSPENLLYAR